MTNGNYTVMQIIIKIKEYTYIYSNIWEYTHRKPSAKSKQYNKNTVQYTDLANNGNQK